MNGKWPHKEPKVVHSLPSASSTMTRESDPLMTNQEHHYMSSLHFFQVPETIYSMHKVLLPRF